MEATRRSRDTVVRHKSWRKADIGIGLFSR